MAYIALNNKFTPYTFDELVKPFAMYDTAYQQERARTDELLEKAALLEDLSPTVDKEAYEAYQGWKDQLRAASEQLAMSGLDTNTRRTITSLGDTYRTDYLPMIAKLKTRGELIKGQREYLQKHPDGFFDIDYSTTPITNVTSSSTYNAYDPEDIFKKVAEHSYSRLSSGQADLTDEQYLSQFGEGISDETQRGRIAQAIQSGKALAAANKKQKDLENYLKELQVRRSYSRGSGSGSSGGVGAPGYGSIVNVTLPDSTTLQLKYNKNTKEYEYKDANKSLKSVKLDGSVTDEDIIKDYYGGYYDKLDVQGTPVRRIISDDGYLVRTPKGWSALPKGGSTTYREYLKATGNEVALPTDDQLRRLPYGIESMDDLNKKIGRGKYTEDLISSEQFADYADNPLLKGIIGKLGPLIDSGMLSDATIRVYKDPRGNVVGYSTDADMSGLSSRLSTPIEQGWRDRKKELDEKKAAYEQARAAVQQNGDFD